MNINRYALRKERSLQKIISKQPKPNTTAIGVCSETQVTHHIITKRSDECLPISAFVPKHKEGDGKKFPVIIDIYGGDFVAGRSALNRNFGTWCAEHGYLTFIPEYTQVPETNLFGQLGDLLKAFVVIHRCAERYGADMSRMYLVGDGAGAALACLVYALLWNPVSMQHLEDELPFDVPQEAKLTFKAVCLQNGILDLSSRKMNAIAPYLIEKDWKKTSYAECLSPKTYAKMLPPCFLVTSITDAHKHDTNQLAWQLKLKGTRYSVHSANNLFAKESFAARHPELDIYALSAFMPENPASVEEKYGWLDVYVPEIDAAHRIFVPCGESKAAAVANRLKMPCIDKSFVLLDDYSVNLHDWKEKGGSGIKLRNGINGSIGTWKGPSVSRFNTPETLATLICQAAKIRANA